MINKFRRAMRRVQIKIRYIRSKFDIVIRNKYPHIKINERYQNKIKWILRVVTVIGIASSVIAFSEWYYSLMFSVIILIIEQLFEQIIFSHNIMLVQPLPQHWDGNKWTGMMLATDGHSCFLGFGFSDKKVGADFFNTILAWNNNAFVNDQNIQLTFVKEDKDNYSVHIYPTIQRDFVKHNYEKAAKNFNKIANAGKELVINVVQICFCKVFPITPSCAYSFLLHDNSNIFVQLYDTSKVNNADPSTYQSAFPMDERTILFKNIKVCTRKELSSKIDTIEYYNVPKY